MSRYKKKFYLHGNEGFGCIWEIRNNILPDIYNNVIS